MTDGVTGHRYSVTIALFAPPPLMAPRKENYGLGMGDGLRGSETGDRKDRQNQSRPMLAGTHLHENLKSADCGDAVTRRREMQRPSLAE